MSVDNPFLNRRVAVRGKLGSMTLQQAAALVRKLGGKFVSSETSPVDLLLLGADELPASISTISSPAAEQLPEAELWRRLGWFDAEIFENADTRCWHTPAMLAELVHVPVHAIRRWYRAGLLQAAHTIHRLPYFEFGEIAIAKQIAELSAGISLAEFQRRLAALQRQFPHVERPLAELTLVLDGNRWLIRDGNQLLEASGQQQFDFAAGDDSDSSPTLAIRPGQTGSLPPTLAQIIAQAEECDAAGETAQAAECYRAALAAHGPNAELSFQLADCLFRLGDLHAARERYLLAIEIDDEHVEARANLGCVLVELGDYDWAIAAFQGALSLHPNYADAHLHLAKLFDALHRPADADPHWQRFASLSLGSPWESLADHRRDDS